MKGWVRSWLEGLGGYLSNGEWILTCPFCDGSKKLYVNNSTGAWICFRCGERSWKFRTLLMKVEGPNWYRTAVLKQGFGFEAEPKPQHESRGDRIDAPLPDEFEPLRKAGKWQVPLYLKKRGIHRRIAHKLGVGFCRSGPYANRIIFPIECPIGKSFTSRTTLPGLEPRYKAGDRAGSLLYGWSSLEWFDGPVVLVEGPIDAVRVIQARYSALAIMGKILSRTKRAAINTIDRPIVVMLDEEALLESIKVAREMGAAIAHSEDDPAEMREEAIQAAVRQAVDPIAYAIRYLIQN